MCGRIWHLHDSDTLVSWVAKASQGLIPSAFLDKYV
jgi:hypothetical protein